LDLAPTIDEVQNVIDESWKAAGVHAAPPPRVLQTLVFFSSSEEYEPYAVVDAHAGNCFHIGDWMVDTVSGKAPQVQAMMECRLGETTVFGADRLLLLARNGGELPPLDSCRSAMSVQERVREHSRTMMTELDEIAHLLAKHWERLTVEAANFARFPELSRAGEIVAKELASIRSFELGLEELRQLPSQRRLVDLAVEIDRESTLLQSFQSDVQSALTSQTETLEAHRRRYEELESARVRDEQFVQEERDRVEALYHEALRSPAPITHPEALAEIRGIVKLADVDGADTFILRRRLYVLRLRCKHSIAPPIADGILRTLLPEIEEEIHRLKRK